MASITYKNASCIYEGSDKLAVDSLNLDICNTLYASGKAIPPYYTYSHFFHVVPGDVFPSKLEKFATRLSCCCTTIRETRVRLLYIHESSLQYLIRYVNIFLLPGAMKVT